MFKHACSFVDCAEFCSKQGSRIDYAKPEIVNSAFACEVFIKSLLFYNGVSFEEIKKNKAQFESIVGEI